MSGRFDDLSRAMAQPMPRRGMLKMLGAAAAAGVGAVVLKPFRADAACNAGDTPCGTGCCPAGVACLDPSTARCGCPAGATQCASTCCSGTCSFTSNGNGCCCDAGTTPCGQRCCPKGVACESASASVCGCPAGYTRCGSGVNLSCCPPGAPCGDSSCKGAAGNPTLGNQIFCTSGGTCRTAGATCFYNKQCCSPMTCSCHNEGYSVCC